MQPDAGDLADQAIGAPGRDLPEQETILPVLSPADQQVELALLDRLDHFGNIGRIVLQVAVKRGDQAPGGSVDAGLHRCRLPEVLLQFDNLEIEARIGKSHSCICQRSVGAAVVNEDQFPRRRKVRQRIADTCDQRLDAVLFVEHGNDDG
ncbi:hypothetical protein D9M72_492830 [compost metagenome]